MPSGVFDVAVGKASTVGPLKGFSMEEEKGEMFYRYTYYKLGGSHTGRLTYSAVVPEGGGDNKHYRALALLEVYCAPNEAISGFKLIKRTGDKMAYEV
jgi:hypothetical protein